KMKTIVVASRLCIALVVMGTATCSPESEPPSREEETEECVCPPISSDGEVTHVELECYCENFHCPTEEELQGYQIATCDSDVIAYGSGDIFTSHTVWFRDGVLIGLSRESDSGTACSTAVLRAGEQHCHPDWCWPEP